MPKLKVGDAMQAIGLSPNLVRLLATTAPDLLAELFVAGKTLEAEVISVFQDRAMLSFGKGVRLEVALQAALREGQKVKLQVQPRDQGGGLVLKLVQPAGQQADRAAPPPAAARAPAPPPATATPAPPPGQPAAPAPAPAAGTPVPTPTPGTPAPAPAPGPAPAVPTPAPGQPAATPAPAAPPATAAPTTPVPTAPPPMPGPAAAVPAPPAPAPAAAATPAPPPGQAAPATPAAAAAAPAAQAPMPSANPGQAPTPALPQPTGQAPQPAAPQAQAQTPQAQAPQAQAQAPQALPQTQTQATQTPQVPPQTQPQTPQVQTQVPQPTQPHVEVPQAPQARAETTQVQSQARPEGPQAQTQPQPAAQAPLSQARLDAGPPPLIWLPIPLENGKQGWAQLQIQERDPSGGQEHGAQHQIRLWWETPALGQIQVTMDASRGSLTTLFTVLLGAIRAGVERGLSDLQTRLTAAGFDDVKIGCRQALPGENIGPAVPVEGGPRLDRRL